MWLGASDLEEEVIIEENNNEDCQKAFLVKIILDTMVLVISQLDDHELRSSKNIPISVLLFYIYDDDEETR